MDGSDWQVVTLGLETGPFLFLFDDQNKQMALMSIINCINEKKGSETTDNRSLLGRILHF
jgi:hypothetical protein